MSRFLQGFHLLLYALEQQQTRTITHRIVNMSAHKSLVQVRCLCNKTSALTAVFSRAQTCQIIHRRLYSALVPLTSPAAAHGYGAAASFARDAVRPLVGTEVPDGTIANTGISKSLGGEHGKTLGSSATDDAASTLDVWYNFLRLLHDQGDFKDTETSCDLLIQQRDDVKDAIVCFSRRRPDILFNLPPLEVAAVAEQELLSRDLPDRKLRNADRRLKDTFVTGRAAAATAPGCSSNGQSHASLQDLMRVLWDWAGVPEATVHAAAPALTQALRHLLLCIRQLAQSPPDTIALEQSQRLGTPTAAELTERRMNQPSVEVRRQVKQAAYQERRHRLRVRDAVDQGTVLEAGDWFCSNCGSVNWGDRQRCFRCDTPSNKTGNTVVMPQDIVEVYGDKPPRRRSRAATAAADADAIYDAQAAAASRAADAAAVATAARGAPSNSRNRADVVPLTRSRKAPLQLATDEEEEEDVPLTRSWATRDATPSGRGGFWDRGEPGGRGGFEDRAEPRGRGGQRRVVEVMRGRPGLRRRADSEAGGDWSEPEEGLDLDDRQGGPFSSETRSSYAYKRSLRDYYDDDDVGQERGQARNRGGAGRGGAVEGLRRDRGSDVYDDAHASEQRRPTGEGGPRVTRQTSSERRGALDDLNFNEWESSASRGHRGSHERGGEGDADVGVEMDGRRGTGSRQRGGGNRSGGRGGRLNWLDEDAEEYGPVEGGSGWQQRKGAGRGRDYDDEGRDKEEDRDAPGRGGPSKGFRLKASQQDRDRGSRWGNAGEDGEEDRGRGAVRRFEEPPAIGGGRRSGAGGRQAR